jgi:Transposase DDE domain
MQMVMRLTEELQRVLMVEANRAARDSGWQQRLRNLRGDTWVQGLVFGCLAHPLPTLEQLAQTMAACGTPVSPQALDQRFNPAAAKCLEQVLARMVQQTVATKPAVSNLLARFTEVRIIDSTTIPLPGVLSDPWKGCRGRTQKVTGSAIKFQVGLELRTGRLLGPHAEAGCASDQKSCLQTEPLPEGALEIADLGYFELDKFATRGRKKAFWLTRWQPNTKIFRQGSEVSLVEFLAGRKTKVVDVPIELGAHHRLPCRLIALRVPEKVVRQRRQRLLKKARKKARRHKNGKRKRPSRERLLLCAWNIYLTNIPSELANATEIRVLGRCRWQIELLFKQWKSDGRIDQSRSAKPWRILCEVFAKLIGAVLQHDFLVLGCWHYDDRSLRKAAATIRPYAAAFAGLLDQPHVVGPLVKQVLLRLNTAPRITKRRRKPSLHQLLDNPRLGKAA